MLTTQTLASYGVDCCPPAPSQPRASPLNYIIRSYHAEGGQASEARRLPGAVRTLADAYPGEDRDIAVAERWRGVLSPTSRRPPVLDCRLAFPLALPVVVIAAHRNLIETPIDE